MGNFVQIMSNLNLPKPKRIDEAVLQNIKCGYSLELDHVNEDNFTMHDLYQLLDKLKPTERVLISGCQVSTIRGHVPGSLNISIGNEQAFIDEIRGY